MNELYHHGIKGQKWGVRRYQNYSGTLTEAGKKRYLTSDGHLNDRGRKQIRSEIKRAKKDIRVLSKNPIIKTLAKDVQDKWNDFKVESRKEQAMVDDFRKNKPLLKKCAKEFATQIADKEWNGQTKKAWQEDGYTKKDFIDVRYHDLLTYDGPSDLYSSYYCKINKDAKDQRDKTRKSWYEYSDSMTEFGKTLVKELGNDVPSKIASGEELKDIAKKTAFYVADLTDKRTVFVSGSSKTQSKDSEYYRKKLPKDIQKALKQYMKEDVKIIVGDAPGIDRQVQDFLKKRRYKNVEVYGPGKQVRYSANKKWKTNPIDAPEFEPGSKEWLAKKDIAMEKAATEGLAVVLDEGAKATRKNVDRLIANNKDVKVYQLNKNGKDEWAKH